MKRWIVLVLAVASLCGCATAPGFVSRDWATNMRELGINPLFPPRAGLSVGDVFIVEGSGAEDLTHSEFSSLGVFFEDLMLQKEILEFYRSRPDFVSSALLEPSLLSYANGNGKESFKLGRVAFPGFLRATASGAEIAALVPAQNVPVGFSSELRNAKSAVLTVSGAESYGLPLNRILAKVGGETELLAKIRGKLQPDSLQSPRYVDVIIINELYFARSFNVTIHSEQSVSASAKVELPSMSGLMSPVASSDAPTPPAPTAAVSESVNAKTAVSLAAAEEKKLSDNLKNAGNRIPTTTGGTLSIGRNATGDITLVQDYPTPIAIGYRGVRRRLQVSFNDAGQSVLTVRVSPSDSSTPLSGRIPLPSQ